MSPYLLGTVEVRIGLIESWPRDILRLLFCSIQTRYNIKTVSSFFYGKGVPVEEGRLINIMRPEQGMCVRCMNGSRLPTSAGSIWLPIMIFTRG